MSVIEPGAIRTPSLKGWEQDERTKRDAQRILSKPQYFPEEFWSNLIDRVGLEIILSSAQVQGLSSSAPQSSRVVAGATVSSTSYITLAGGPSFSALGAGVYILTFGANYNSNTGGDGLVSVSVNGSSASDDDAAEAQATVSETRFNLSNILTLNLEEDSNSVEIVYRVRSGNGDFYRRYATIQRTGNL